MGEPIVLLALIRKRAELAGEVQKVQAKLDLLLGDLAAVDRVLSISGFTGEAEAIPPKVRGSPTEREDAARLRQFVRDRLASAATPIRSSEIAAAYMDASGIAGRDPRTREFYRGKVTNVLIAMRNRGQAQMVGKYMHALWAIK
ncbi:MAG: hypothetical protein IPK78_06435 [Rhodospirillales bacterium]|nr:hypothetical protein [Rhodospirillales bacterium]